MNGRDYIVQFLYTPIDEWPPLAWLARCDVSRSVIEVFHGNRVETQKEWFCEAIWAGDYEAGNFDQTDIIFGSGGRIRGEGVTFVSSGSTLDRLHALRAGDCVWISNSLVCLLAAVGGVVDPTYPRYFEDFGTITRGIKDYKRTLATSAGPVQLTYYNNLRWDGERITEEMKPYPVRDFGSFSRYRKFLESSLGQLSENMSSGVRKYPYKMMGTISSGYDSPTVVALARRFGLKQAISFDRSTNGESDSGEEIAKILGVRSLVVERNAWRSMRLSEVPFIASDAKGEDVYYGVVGDRLAGCVLLTGLPNVWNKETKYLTENIVRGDQSGLSLSEYRLWIGFIHCPVPFMGVRQIKDIHAISHSPEMSPWDVSGDYNKPICRRIVEESGVPRDKFGVKKKGASVLFNRRDSFLSPQSLDDLLRWLEENSLQRPKKGGIPPSKVTKRLVDAWQAVKRVVKRGLAVAGVAPHRIEHVRSIAHRLDNLVNGERLFRYVFPWAIERAKERYASSKAANHGLKCQVD